MNYTTADGILALEYNQKVINNKKGRRTRINVFLSRYQYGFNKLMQINQKQRIMQEKLSIGEDDNHKIAEYEISIDSTALIYSKTNHKDVMKLLYYLWSFRVNKGTK